MTPFSYAEFTTRNAGFVTQAEQMALREACILVCGTGGMGGAAVQALVRAGVGRLILADIDHFEMSNMNRQVFASLPTLGQPKADATRAACLAINPEAEIEVLHDDWPDHVARATAQASVVLNGTDDLGASLLLYRTARDAGRAVIDAYAAPLPSLYVTGPADPMPEERLHYPTIGTAWNALSPDQRAQAAMAEAEYVLTHSSSRHHVDLGHAAEVLAGRRARMSFAPMVMTTGMLMAGAGLDIAMGRKPGADHRGWFFNPHRGRVERPLPAPLAALARPLVRRRLRQLAGGA